MDLYILVDSSTKPTSKHDKRGESIAAWAAWWSNDSRGKPVAAGVHYLRHSGPNKCFYLGIIRALEHCLPMCWSNKVIIMGDCEPVLKQLNKIWQVSSMALEYKQVMGLIKKYKEKGNEIVFSYLSENNSEYKNIDQLAKRSHKHFLTILKR
ncbi:MAG TPA: reverse transcriptase-like protein [Candidatus Paceibacterota bacterium]|nr:reverse transcriptase-like protein [Candidatus Paceibacterota bacterium]